MTQLDPTFLAALWAPVVHYIAKYTQDVHGKTRPFVAYLCVGMGFLVNFLFLLFGKDTVSDYFWQFVDFALVSFAFATAIWVFTHKPNELVSRIKKD